MNITCVRTHSVNNLLLDSENAVSLSKQICGNTHILSSHLCPPYLILDPLPLLNTHPRTDPHDGHLNQVAALSRSLFLSTFSHCSVHSYGSKCFTSQQHSLAPSISILLTKWSDKQDSFSKPCPRVWWTDQWQTTLATSDQNKKEVILAKQRQVKLRRRVDQERERHSQGADKSIECRSRLDWHIGKRTSSGEQAIEDSSRQKLVITRSVESIHTAAECLVLCWGAPAKASCWGRKN